MKKITVTLFIVLITHAGFSQTNNAYQNTLDSVSKVVIHYFQAKQPDSIYALAGEKFKSQLTAENFKSVSETQIFPLNDFQHVTYISTTNGMNKYKVDGSPDLQLLISLDKDNKVETLLIQPFSNN